MTKLDELERLSKAATPGNWNADASDSYSPVRASINGESFLICDCDLDMPDSIAGKTNALLIATMRNSIDQLIEIAKSAQKQVKLMDQWHLTDYVSTDLSSALIQLERSE